MNELIAELEFDIRFSETDAMGVVWHGNYLKYFEDARESFGKKFGMDYFAVYTAGFFTPIVKSELNHKSPLYYGQRAKIFVKYIPTKAAKIIFEYKIVNLSTNKISATGSTVQVFLTKEKRELDLNKPQFFVDWETKCNIKL